MKFRLWAVVGVVAIALMASLASCGGGDESADSSSGEAEIVSVEALRDQAGGAEPPVYWAGERVEAEIELSEPEKGLTYVRYLDGDAKAGDPRPTFLTVGTYESDDPVAALKSRADEPGGVLGKAPGGATVYFSQDDPSSVYLAYPGVEAQIEVFDPNFKRALQLVNSGQIVPVS